MVFAIRSQTAIAATIALVLCACSPEQNQVDDDGISSLSDNDSGSTTNGTDDDGTDDNGTGELKLDVSGGGDGDTTDTGVEDCETTLVATVRDFQSSHPDFENSIGYDPGIVQFMLGPDHKPVYAGNPSTQTTNGQEYFDQWYRDVPGVNQSFEIEIPLTDNMDGTYTYANSAFFPIDGQGFGNEFYTHNYHFTLDLHAEFIYEGGEVFEFTGDDDLFTFVNGSLGIDLGGVHGPLNGQIDMDAMAATLDIQVGETYTLDFFFAERHTSESNFRIDTTIACITVPEIG